MRKYEFLKNCMWIETMLLLTHCVSVNKLNRDVAVGGGKNIQDDLSWQVLLPYRTN